MSDIGTGINRREFLRRTAAAVPAAAVLSAADGPAAGSPAGIHDLGGNRHVFLDEFLIAEKHNVSLCVNPPERKELALIAEKPWERGGLTSYANAFHDPIAREYRLYYVPVHLESNPIFRLALAVSKDGLQWTKPDLGAVEWNGSKKNNIVIEGQREGTVLVDPNAPRDRQYAFLSSEGGLKTRLFTSPDGIHWKMHPEPIAPIHSDSQISTFWDAQLKKYVHYPRIGHRGRAVGRVETSRMDEPWPRQIPMVMSGDDHDPPDTDLYTNAAEKYTLASNAYVAFPTPYYHYDPNHRKYLNEPTLKIGGKTNDGTLDTQLATSRDGKAWIRHRVPYVPLYRHEGLDFKVCMVFPGLLYHPDRIDHFLAAYAFTHGDTQARVRLQGRALGGYVRLQQRIDGFMSADFAYGGGSLTTAPFTFKGKHLVLNANTSAAGEARVALLDAGGKPMPGHGIEDCRIVNGDYLARQVTWKGSDDLSAFAGQPVRLRCEMRGTKLYAFQFVDVLGGA